MSNFDFLTNKTSLREKLTKQKQKRKGPDIFNKLAFFLVLVALVLLTIALIFIFKSAPQAEDLFSRINNVSVRKTWNTSLLSSVYYLSWLLLLISVLNLIIFKFRCKRKSDKVSKIVVFSMVISLIFIILFSLFF